MTSAATRIVVLDYGIGNRRSVVKALEHVGADVALTADAAAVESAAGLVVPGVGAFGAAMEALRAAALDELIVRVARAGTPVLGICLGMQLLFDRSCELGEHDGLGLIAGEVTPLDADHLRVPHIGWNEVTFERASPLLAGLPRGRAAFYHVHSFAVRPRDRRAVIGTTEYGERFATIVGADNVLGTQFHPEKSSVHGLAVLSNFAAICGARRTAGPVAA